MSRLPLNRSEQRVDAYFFGTTQGAELSKEEKKRLKAEKKAKKASA